MNIKKTSDNKIKVNKCNLEKLYGKLYVKQVQCSKYSKILYYADKFYKPITNI